VHFVIGLFLLCVILAVPALRAVAFLLLILGVVAFGGLMTFIQRDNDHFAAKTGHSILVDEDGNPLPHRGPIPVDEDGNPLPHR
jgi:hypothetical protein